MDHAVEALLNQVLAEVQTLQASDAEPFNFYVKAQIKSLSARGETSR
jgi:hypothetical protein